MERGSRRLKENEVGSTDQKKTVTFVRFRERVKTRICTFYKGRKPKKNHIGDGFFERSRNFFFFHEQNYHRLRKKLGNHLEEILNDLGFPLNLSNCNLRNQ